MKDAGPAWMSIGNGSGQNRAADAAKDALSSPLLDVSIQGATGVLFHIVGGSNLSLFEVSTAADVIKQAVGPDANIIFGIVLDPNMGTEIRLTLIATGFPAKEAVMTGSSREKQMIKLLKGIKTEEELEVPSFMRQRQVLPGQRRTMTMTRN